MNMLAEVKAFEYLYEQSFTGIAKLRQQPDRRTVDFIAMRNSQRYAVEVTRLGLAQAKRKKPEYDKLSKPPFLYIIDSKQPRNITRIEEDIYDKIIDKYPQIREFCLNSTGKWKGVLLVSNGRDYFVARRYGNKEYELQPRTVGKVLTRVWKALHESKVQYEYLHHIVVTMGKDLEKAIAFPPL